MQYYKLYINFLFFILWSSFTGQEYTLDTIKSNYPFVNWKSNQLIGAETSPAFKKLFRKFQAIAEGKKKDLHIFHMGGSHIQADIYSNRLRTYLQNMNTVSEGQRGFVFPYKIAKTNNPSNYKVAADGEWQGYRCSIMKDSIAWGLAGITAAFRDSTTTVKINANYRGYDQQNYDFNRIRIFYDNWSDDYEIQFENSELIKKQLENNKAHYREYVLKKTVDELQFCV